MIYRIWMICTTGTCFRSIRHVYNSDILVQGVVMLSRVCPGFLWRYCCTLSWYDLSDLSVPGSRFLVIICRIGMIYTNPLMIWTIQARQIMIHLYDVWSPSLAAVYQGCIWKKTTPHFLKLFLIPGTIYSCSSSPKSQTGGVYWNQVNTNLEKVPFFKTILVCFSFWHWGGV